ncbi:MAG: AAA family ATPase [Bdellovibrionales bacterium]|nr:AAA family ATPase [Bdellovibrionales bacterium]
MSDTELQEQIKSKGSAIREVVHEAEKVVVGQRSMLDRIMMGFLCDGHILLEGLPGLAKTLAVKTVANVMDLSFNRIQFTPDLLPSDLVGSMIYNQKTGEFTAKQGPVFANIVLADEINRAPAKVQSALLESMAEHQVTIGEKTFPLPDPFIVLATQNPIEQEGTYNLPEAQLDRFMFKVKVHYPSQAEEKTILDRMSGLEAPKTSKKVLPRMLTEARALTTKIYIDEKVKDYILNIVFTSRFPEKRGLTDLKSWIQVGGSPRATIFLAKASRGMALLHGRSYVTPDDVKAVCYDVLRHRLVLSYEAEANDVTPEAVIRKILDVVEVP